MSIFYRFKSAKDYETLSIVSDFISVRNLKERIIVEKKLGRGTDYDLIVTHAQTNEEYLDETTLIRKQTSVLIRRIPRPSKPIVSEPDKPLVDTKVDDQVGTSNVMSASTKLDVLDFDDDFGGDPYAIAKDTTKQSGIIIQDSTATTKAVEDSKVKALVRSSVVDRQSQAADGFVQGRDFAGGGSDGHGGGRDFVFRQIKPHWRYVCYRCNIPGHFIQHCPTNGDPNYDIGKVKPPTADGFSALPKGTFAVLKPDEAAFEKEIEGIASTRSILDLPPELYCPLCKEVMRNAVFTSRCCHKSYCDTCIRDYIISNSMCVCEAKNILADDLVPNTTARDTINGIHVQGIGNSTAHESARVKGQQSQSGARLVEKVEQKLDVGSEGKKKKKVCLLQNDTTPASNHPNLRFPVADMQWPNMQPFNYHGYVGNMPYNTGYYQGPMHIPTGNVMPPESYWPQNYMTSSMFPNPCQRYDEAGVGPPFPRREEFEAPQLNHMMGMSVRPPLPSREESEAIQFNVPRNEEMERRFNNWMLPGDHDDRDHSNINSNVLSKPSLPRRRSPSPAGYAEDDRRRKRQNLPQRQRTPIPDKDYSRRQKERSPLSFDENRNRIDHSQSSYRHQRDGTSSERRDSDTHRHSLKRKAEYHHSDFPRDSRHRGYSYGHQSEEDPAKRGHLSKYANKGNEGGGSRRYQQKTSSSLGAKEYDHDDDHREVRENMAAAKSTDYESRDDERHCNRKRRKHESRDDERHCNRKRRQH